MTANARSYFRGVRLPTPTETGNHLAPSMAKWPAYARLQAVCGTGRTTVAIDPYGNIYPCIQWRRKAGNILEVDDLTQLWRQSEVLETVRDLAMQIPKTTLQDCESGEFCTFCLGVAEVQTGDPLSMYPQALTNARAKAKSFGEPKKTAVTAVRK